MRTFFLLSFLLIIVVLIALAIWTRFQVSAIKAQHPPTGLLSGMADGNLHYRYHAMPEGQAGADHAGGTGDGNALARLVVKSLMKGEIIHGALVAKGKHPPKHTPEDRRGNCAQGMQRQLVQDVVVEDGGPLARGLEAMGVRPGGEWAALLDVTKLLPWDVLVVVRLPGQGDGPLVDAKLQDVAVFDAADLSHQGHPLPRGTEAPEGARAREPVEQRLGREGKGGAFSKFHQSRSSKSSGRSVSPR